MPRGGSLVLLLLLPFHCVAAESRFVPLTEFQGTFGFTDVTLMTDTLLVIEKPGWRLSFETDSRKAFFNGVLVWMNAPMSRVGNKRIFSRTDIDTLAHPIMTGRHGQALVQAPRVILDPGHGGDDTGAMTKHLRESKVVLDIARRLQHRLASGGVQVSLTRDRNRSMELSTRAARAAASKAALFVSIHLNSAANRDAEGIETYVLPAAGYASTSGQKTDLSACPGNRFDQANTRFAYLVHKALLNRTMAPDRGIKHARFEVLKLAPCPALLVECGFVSCPAEEKRLMSSQYLDTVTEGLYDGILNSIRELTLQK